MSAQNITPPDYQLDSGSSNQGRSPTPPPKEGEREPTHPETGTAAVSAEVTALKHGLASLKKQTERKHKPWYLDYSKTIPIFVSLVTVAISFYTISLQRAENAQKSVEALRETISQIVEMRFQNTEKMMSGGDPGLLQIESSLLNQKKLALQEKARGILRSPNVRAQISAPEMRSLAVELGYSGYVQEAEQILQSSLSTLRHEGKVSSDSSNDIETAYTLTALAYFEIVNDHGFDAGRRDMQGTVDIFRKKGGTFSQRPLIETYLSWSNMDLAVGNTQQARQEFQEARKVLNAMDELNVDRPVLAALCAGADQLIRTKETQTVASNPMDWYGTWSIRFDRPRQRQGSLRLNWNRQTNLVEAHVELFDGAQLAELYAGTGVLLSASQLRIDWGQIWRITNPLAPAQPNLGYTLFNLASPRHLKINSYLLGESPTLGTARKTN